MKDLQGKIVLVTGASRGIGRAIALAFADAGSRVALAGRSQGTLAEVATEIDRRGGAPLAIACDVTQQPEVADLKHAIAERFGPVQILVNNIGMAPAAGFLEMEDSLWEEVLRVNLTSTYRCCKAFLGEMVAARWGRIINIASTVAKVAYPHISAYATSKHAVLGLTRSLALESAKFGVTVNAVCPGYVNTELTRQNAQRMARNLGKSVDEALDLFRSSCPQRRLIEPEEVASLTVMLASGSAGGITGQAINVDGGAVMM